MYGELEWLKVRRLAQQGLKYMKIGHKLGIDRRTVKKLTDVNASGNYNCR